MTRQRMGFGMADDTTLTEDENEASAEEALAVDVLVEEVSIDGMCGVY